MSQLLQRHGKATIHHLEGVRGGGLLNDDWVDGWPASWLVGVVGYWVSEWKR